MKLLTKEIKSKLPLLYLQEGENDPTVHAKFFLGPFTWYVLEGQEADGGFLFFGEVVSNMGSEFGYFTLEELEEVRSPIGTSVERDIHFSPKPLSEVAR